jgi:purine-cytosine permease-like protein
MIRRGLVNAETIVVNIVARLIAIIIVVLIGHLFLEHFGYDVSLLVEITWATAAILIPEIYQFIRSSLKEGL